MTTQADRDFEEWLAFHKPQLEKINLPESLHRKLFQKLKFEDFDIFQTAKIILDQDEERVNLVATKTLQKHSDVFLIDHAWSFRFEDAFSTLYSNSALVERLEKLTEYSEKLEIPSVPQKPKDNPQIIFKRQLE